jgi:hypothetical protein
MGIQLVKVVASGLCGFGGSILVSRYLHPTGSAYVGSGIAVSWTVAAGLVCFVVFYMLLSKAK